MDIVLDKVIPHPLLERSELQSDVWQQSLTFKAGDAIHIAAPSGSGKTSLIHILYGLRKDYQGKIEAGNKDIATWGINDWAESRQYRLSIIFQDLRLFPDFTGMENILIKSTLAGDTTDEAIYGMAEQLGIKGLLSKKCKLMSQGERQRMAIIRAMTQPFEWLLMDEPFSHLDEENTRKACELITSECKKRNAGFIMASLGEEYFMNYDIKLKL